MEEKKIVKNKSKKIDENIVDKEKNAEIKQEQKNKALNSETENKVSKYYGWTAYILFFIPLIFNSKNKEVRFHVNQGFWLNMVEIAGVFFTWLFFVGYRSANLPNWIKSISFVLFIAASLSLALLIMVAFYLIFLCISQNGKEIKCLNKIKVFNKEK